MQWPCDLTVNSSHWPELKSTEKLCELLTDMMSLLIKQEGGGLAPKLQQQQ